MSALSGLFIKATIMCDTRSRWIGQADSLAGGCFLDLFTMARARASNPFACPERQSYQASPAVDAPFDFIGNREQS